MRHIKPPAYFITREQAPVLKAMADAMRQEGCLPGDRTLAEQAGINHRTVCYHRARLTTAGLITRADGKKRKLAAGLIIEPKVASIALEAWRLCRDRKDMGGMRREDLVSRLDVPDAEKIIARLIRHGYLKKSDRPGHIKHGLRLTYEHYYLNALAADHHLPHRRQT